MEGQQAVHCVFHILEMLGVIWSADAGAVLVYQLKLSTHRLDVHSTPSRRWRARPAAGQKGATDVSTRLQTMAHKVYCCRFNV